MCVSVCVRVVFSLDMAGAVGRYLLTNDAIHDAHRHIAHMERTQSNKQNTFQLRIISSSALNSVTYSLGPFAIRSLVSHPFSFHFAFICLSHLYGILVVRLDTTIYSMCTNRYSKMHTIRSWHTHRQKVHLRTGIHMSVNECTLPPPYVGSSYLFVLLFVALDTKWMKCAYFYPPELCVRSRYCISPILRIRFDIYWDTTPDTPTSYGSGHCAIGGNLSGCVCMCLLFCVYETWKLNAD